MEKREKVYSDEQLRGLIVQDLNCAVAVVNMILNDAEMLKAVQDIAIQRVRAQEENAKLNPELEFQK